MTAILLVGHGSRVDEAAADMYRVAELISNSFPVVESAFLGLSRPDIREGIEKCIERGADKVIIMPYFLNAGAHVKNDFKKVLDSMDYGDIKIILGEHIGFHPKLAEIIIEKAEDADAANK